MMKRLIKHIPKQTSPIGISMLMRNKGTSWAHVQPVALDAIKQLTIKFNQDENPSKILLGEGVYKTNEGESFILPSVRQVEKILYEKELAHEYAPVSGVESFNVNARQFAFGDNSSAISDNRIATVQTISGTGALRLAAQFLKKFYQGPKVIYMPKPTWVNHIKIFEDEGFEVQTYRYFDPNTYGLDEAGAMEDLKNAPEEAIVMFHACAHNPTGVDPSESQWKQFAQICAEKNMFVFFDSAYQGFASGDPDKDASSFRLFTEDFGLNPLVCQSFSKNFGLYGERVGALNIVTDSSSEAEAIRSNLMTLIRSSYSNPPIYGARIVSEILDNYYGEWSKDVQTMANRIKAMRSALVEELKRAGSTRDWSHIEKQIGMFAYSGLTADQVQALQEKHHIYMTGDGRISISGLNENNVRRVAEAIHDVTC